MNLPELYEQRTAKAPILVEEPAFFRGGGGGEDDGDITFSYLWALLRRRLPLMLITAGLCLMLGVLWTLASPRIYQAVADVVLITDRQALVPGADPAPEEARLRTEDVETQIELIDKVGLPNYLQSQMGSAS